MVNLNPSSRVDRMNLWLPTVSDVGHILLKFGFDLDLIRSWGDRECYMLNNKYIATYHFKIRELNILSDSFRFSCKINNQDDLEIILKDLKNNNINVQ